MKNLLPLSRVVQNLTRTPGLTSSVCSKLQSPLLISARTHLGYIPYQGRLGRQLSNHERFLIEMRKINLQPIKKATFTFDPMRYDYDSIRNFMYFFNKPKVLETNVKVAIKTDIVDDRSDPLLKLELNDGRDLEIKTGNLSELDILRVMNYFVLPLVSEEKAALETKSSKAGGGAGKKKRK